jgi:hypothetical protein
VEVLPLCLIAILNNAIVSRNMFLPLLWFKLLLVEVLPLCFIAILNYAIVSRYMFLHML